MKHWGRFLFLVMFLVGFYGCAGTLPTAEFKKPLNEAYRLCAEDEANVRLVAADGVPLNDVSRQRLESRLKEAINTRKKNASCKNKEKRNFILDSKITRYDEGNAFARAMLAGLGQIHIDGDFELLLSTPKENESVAQFTLKKTFAWGGIYGGTTRIEDIEVTFSGGVAEAIVAPTQEKTEAPSKTPEKTPEKSQEAGR